MLESVRLLLLIVGDLQVGEVPDGAGSAPEGDRSLRVSELQVVNQQARLGDAPR